MRRNGYGGRIGCGLRQDETRRDEMGVVVEWGGFGHGTRVLRGTVGKRFVERKRVEQGVLCESGGVDCACIQTVWWLFR